MLKLISLFWLVLSMLTGALGQQKTVPYDPADYENDLPACVIEGDVRVELLRDSLVRLEVKGPRGFENRPSFTVEKRTGWSDIAFADRTENGCRVIETERYSVFVPLGAQSVDGCRITDRQGKTVWQFETDTTNNVYLPSPSDALQSWSFTDAPRVIPSEDGYTPARNLYENNGWDLKNDAQDVFVFLPGGSYKTFTQDFTDLTGKTEMLPLSLLGYWDSRYYEYNQQSAWRQINDYYDRGYPLDVLVIDTDWRISTGGTGYNINRMLFPTFELFAKKAHDKGVSLVFNDHPEPTRGSENLLDPFEMYYRTENLTKILKKGLDYWWYDRNWWTSLKPIHEDLSIYTTGMYAYHWTTKQYYEDAAKCGESARRPIIMANVDGVGNGTLEYPSALAAHRYALQWTGDIGTSGDALRQEIENMVLLGSEVGLPYTSSDLGGHTGTVTDDMYVRWIQYGALSPIMRVHCTKPYARMPWLFGETAAQVTHTYTDLRYRLLPVYYALAHENYETGLPLLRRLDIAYPQYSETDRNDEYLLGSDLLVAPLSESNPHATDYTFTSGGKPGLKGEYFANDTFSGEPEVVKQDAQVWFDWVYNAPQGLSVSDYFSVRWTGELTVGAKPLYLTAYADDGVRIWIDGEKVVDGWDTFNTYFSTDFLPANSTHSIKIEYCDGNNHAHIFVSAFTTGDVSRDVFLPDGAWMDVWTGETYSGPQTITVSHSLETSPLFVRMGSVLPLADNMKNTSEKDWRHLTLDVFPGADSAGNTDLYEDDVSTVAYKDGACRTTKITLSGSKAQTLTIHPARGSFTGSRAFGERSYTVRIHARKGWGALTAAALNGTAVTWATVKQDKTAAPLAILGGARDADVYEISFAAPVSEKSKLTFTFAQAPADGVNSDYDRSEADFSLSVRKLQKENATFAVDGSARDFALYAVNGNFEQVRKQGGDGSIGDVQMQGERNLFDDNYRIHWQDGDEPDTGSTTCGLVSNRSFTASLHTSGKETFRLYVGGFRSAASLTVRDRSGSVQTVSFGDLGGNYYREVTVDASGNADLEVTYRLLCGSNITLAACVAQ